MKHAQHLLISTGKPVKEIALACNRNLHTKYSLKDISSRFNVGTTYLCTLFSKYLGFTR